MKRSSLLIILILMLFVGSVSLHAKSQQVRGRAKVALRSANVYYNRGITDKALVNYLKVLEDMPDNIEALKNVADIYFDFGLKPENIPDSFTGDDKNPIKNYYNAAKYYKQAIAVIDSIPDWKEYTDGDKILADCKKFHNNVWIKIFNLGQVEFNEGNYDEAEKIYEELKDYAPDSVKTYLILGFIQDKKNNEEKKMEYFQKILEKDPDNIQILESMASTAYNKDNYEKALEYYEKLIKINPTKTEYYNNMAYSYYKTNNNQKAFEYYEKVIELDPNDIGAIVNAAEYAQTFNDDAKTQKYFLMAFDKQPSAENAKNLAIYYNGKQNSAKALEYAQKWYELDNTDKGAVETIIYCARQTKNKALETKFNNILKTMN